MAPLRVRQSDFGIAMTKLRGVYNHMDDINVSFFFKQGFRDLEHTASANRLL